MLIRSLSGARSLCHIEISRLRLCLRLAPASPMSVVGFAVLHDAEVRRLQLAYTLPNMNPAMISTTFAPTMEQARSAA